MISPWIYPGLKTAEDIASDIWDINKYRLYEKTRKRKVVEARMVVMVYRNLVLKFSMAKSAKPYGLDHCTMLHAKKTVRNLEETNPVFRDKLNLFYQRVKFLKQ